MSYENIIRAGTIETWGWKCYNCINKKEGCFDASVANDCGFLAILCSSAILNNI